MLKYILPIILFFVLDNTAHSVDYSYDPNREVDVELLLLVDVSQSMDKDEQAVQREGYYSALTSKEFIDAIRYGPTQKIAISYAEWAGVNDWFVVADWQVVKDMSSARKFATKIKNAPIRQLQRTSISKALENGQISLNTNDYDGLRRVIDISGDGPNNQGVEVTQIRDRLVADKITINGLPLMLKKSKSAFYVAYNVDKYYKKCVIGGTGNFHIAVRSNEHFADAIRMKLVMEVAGLTFEKSDIVRVSNEENIDCTEFSG